MNTKKKIACTTNESDLAAGLQMQRSKQTLYSNTRGHMEIYLVVLNAGRQ